MKNPNHFPASEPTSEKNELPPLEKYRQAHSLILQKIIEANPDLDYLQYDDDLLVAKGSDFPIINEAGNVGKSIFSGTLGQDDLKGKNLELSEKIKKMFDDFEAIDPDVHVEKFPKPQDYRSIEESQNIGKKVDSNLVKAQTIYVNAKLMEKEGLLKKEEVEEIIRNSLEKLLGKKPI